MISCTNASVASLVGSIIALTIWKAAGDITLGTQSKRYALEAYLVTQLLTSMGLTPRTMGAALPQSLGIAPSPV